MVDSSGHEQAAGAFAECRQARWIDSFVVHEMLGTSDKVDDAEQLQRGALASVASGIGIVWRRLRDRYLVPLLAGDVPRAAELATSSHVSHGEDPAAVEERQVVRAKVHLEIVAVGAVAEYQGRRRVLGVSSLDDRQWDASGVEIVARHHDAMARVVLLSKVVHGLGAHEREVLRVEVKVVRVRRMDRRRERVAYHVQVERQVGAWLDLTLASDDAAAAARVTRGASSGAWVVAHGFRFGARTYDRAW